MQVVNIHKRIIQQPKIEVSKLFKTLATECDLVWPFENWPAIRFRTGVKIGSEGGHGRIRYTITEFKEGELIRFQFSKPYGFMGTHELRIEKVEDEITEIIHQIKMKTTLRATLIWLTAIRWLHDALIEDAFDKVENYFFVKKKQTKYKVWVKLLREVYKRKSFQTKHA